MKSLLVGVLISLVFFPVCFSEVKEKENLPTFLDKIQGKTNKPPFFCTPYGDIEKGLVTVEVMEKWGNPSRIFSKNKDETWYYYFEDDECIRVHFRDGKVTKVDDNTQKDTAQRQDNEE